MDGDPYMRKLHFRAHHRGTREADALIGGFFDRHSDDWDERERRWFEQLLEEQDVDIIGWAMGTATPPAAFAGRMMDTLKQLDFIALPDGIRD